MPSVSCARLRRARRNIERAVIACALIATGFPVDTGWAHEPYDADAPVTSTAYESVLSGYERIEIVKKPDDWRSANDLAEELDGPRGQILDLGEKPERRNSQ